MSFMSGLALLFFGVTGVCPIAEQSDIEAYQVWYVPFELEASAGSTRKGMQDAFGPIQEGVNGPCFDRAVQKVNKASDATTSFDEYKVAMKVIFDAEYYVDEQGKISFSELEKNCRERNSCWFDMY